MSDNIYLQAGRCVESDDPAIIAFSRKAVGAATDATEKAVLLYKAVRDGIIYDPYDRIGRADTYSAKRALERKRGFCIPKAALLAACARASGIPARLGFADVRNHLASPRLIKANNGDIFRWHSYTELYLDGKWVKATPAFDIALCERCNLEPLEFDGKGDSILHPFDRNQRRHMEYLLDRGSFADVPVAAVIATFREHSPALLDDALFLKAKSFAEEVVPVKGDAA